MKRIEPIVIARIIARGAASRGRENGPRSRSRFTNPFANVLLAPAIPPNRYGGRKMTTRTEKVLLAFIIAALTGVAAMASETINYTYDARGRLVQVKHSGSVNNNVTANYQYDKADNRANVNVASPNPAP